MDHLEVATSTELDRFLRQTRERLTCVLEEWGDRARVEMGGVVGEAIAYSLEAPGKGFRPALVLAVYRELGGSGDAAELAAAIEVVHTYSLVHDDLPCMDDDDLRRGRPTVHNRFDAATATVAGFRMVPLAARVLAAGANRLDLGSDVVSRMGEELFAAAGAGGMVGGQFLDLLNEGRSLSVDRLVAMHQKKTGALIQACCGIGAAAAGARGRQLDAIRAYGAEIGTAFQIADDVLDATASSAELGKTAGKDARQNKATFVTVLGLEQAAREAESHVQRAIDQLGGGGIDSLLLEELARFIIERRS